MFQFLFRIFLCLSLVGGQALAQSPRTSNPSSRAAPAKTEAAPKSEERSSNTPAAIVPAHATHGMVVAQEPIAAKVGVDILRKGGNAVDAAVAVAFALAVTYPCAGNIGG